MAPRRGRGSARNLGAPMGLHGRAGTVIGAVFIVLALLIAGGVTWLYQGEKSSRIELSATDLCPKDVTRHPPAVYVVLIDQTDPLVELARIAVANDVLQKLQNELEVEGDSASIRHARVEVWTFSHGGGPNTYKVGSVELALSQALSMCNPGAPAKWDHLYRNVDVVKRQYERFYSSLRQIIISSLNFKEAPRSPIIEALYGIGAKVFSAPEYSESKKRLILISDLIQGTQPLDFFAPGYKPNFQSWRNSIGGRQSLPELRNVYVTAIMIPGSRPDLQSDALAFWSALFQTAGATLRLEKKP